MHLPMQKVARDLGLIPGLRRYPRTGNGHPLQYSCLENSMDRGIWQATVHEIEKSRTRLSDLVRERTHRETHTPHHPHPFSCQVENGLRSSRSGGGTRGGDAGDCRWLG